VSQSFDPVKDRLNLRHHGVSLALGLEVLADPLGMEREDRSMDYGEVRYQVIGMARSAIYLVVYTERAAGPWFISVRKKPPPRRSTCITGGD